MIRKSLKQLMPQEIEVWYIIPAVRRELAKSMVKIGLKQKQIAVTLGITEAAVSQYLKLDRYCRQNCTRMKGYNKPSPVLPNLLIPHKCLMPG